MSYGGYAIRPMRFVLIGLTGFAPYQGAMTLRLFAFGPHLSAGQVTLSLKNQYNVARCR